MNSMFFLGHCDGLVGVQEGSFDGLMEFIHLLKEMLIDKPALPAPRGLFHRDSPLHAQQ